MRAAGDSENAALIYDVNNVQFFIKGAATPGNGIDVADGEWHHVAVTWQSSDGETNIYVDGVNEYNGTLGAGASVTQGGHLALGHEQDAVDGAYDPNQRLNGDLDEVVVFDFVLSEEQVAAHYNALQGDMCDE